MKNFLFIISVLVNVAGFSVSAHADDSSVVVEINKGKMVKFSAPASSVVIADPTTADVQMISPKTVFVYGKKIGETSISAVGADDETIFQGVVEVTHNLSSLQRTVRRVAPDSDVKFKTVDGGLVIDGSAVSVQQSDNIRGIAAAYVGNGDKVVNMMTTGGGDQVMLQVKIVEMARTDLKKLGVNLQASLTGGGIVSQVVNGAVAATALNAARAGATNVQSTLTGGSGSVSSLVEALETEGLATVLAEPSLTTATGKPASFLAGGQYPIPVAGGNGTVTVQYQPFGVSLNFTPVVMSNDRISVLVNPEVSTLNFANPIQVAGFTYPILDTRKAQATVELGSGQTFVLAGLLRNDSSNSISKLPGAGDIPILGALFRSQSFQNNQTELVILVTPYVVHPVSEAKKMQTPLDGLKLPTDAERVILGSLYQQQDMPDEELSKAKKAVSDSTTDKEVKEASDSSEPSEPKEIKPVKLSKEPKKVKDTKPAKAKELSDNSKKLDNLSPSAGGSSKKKNDGGFILE